MIFLFIVDFYYNSYVFCINQSKINKNTNKNEEKKFYQGGIINASSSLLA